jgi:hypothetical protein
LSLMSERTEMSPREGWIDVPIPKIFTTQNNAMD